MTTFVSVIGIVGRAIGGVLTSSLGWAGSLLYGRVPADHRRYLDLILGASLLWGLLVLVVLIPGVGSFLLTSTPFVGSFGFAVLRTAIVAGLVLLPAVVGLAGCLVPDERNRPRGAAILVQIARGYPLTILITLASLFLPAVGLARKVGNARRQWSDAHIAIVVMPRAYDALVEDLRSALDRASIETSVHDAPGVLLVPGRLLALLGGKHVEGLVPDRLVELRGDDLEITVYPSDVAISGETRSRLGARVVLMTTLATAHAHFTSHAESQAFEDRIARLARRDDPTRAAIERSFRELDAALAELDIPTEDWDVLFRLRLQAERDLLRS
jgi:MFS family permease